MAMAEEQPLKIESHTTNSDPTESSHSSISLDPTKSNEKDIATWLEHISRELILAINARNFDPDSFPWQHVSEIIETTRGAGQSGIRSIPKSDLLKSFVYIASLCPDHRIEISSVDVVVHKSFVWSRKGRTAEVFLNCQATGGPGFPVGMARKYVNVFEFKFVDGEDGTGRWVAMKESLIDGMGDMMS